ncbi:MAG: hypothetical protein CYPHOPRED_005008 [Cyphobasidiales sp. Tagirdzhanova-0007]|nr:MAG: hypothetical protein CYPHOPRED_005008 [Cyphobasidiales sp. Tagirdzhanova-0007]
MLGLSILLYWYRRFVLGPLGLTARIKLVHNAQECIVGDESHRQSLLVLLKLQCPSLIGNRAWYSGSFWLFGSGHFQVSLRFLRRFSRWTLIPVFWFLLQTAYSALGNFSNVFKIEYERKFLSVPDGGTICIDIAPPLRDTPPDNRPTLVCMHGLTGGSQESYVRSVLATLCKPKNQGGQGWRGVVVNSRGCANGPLKTPKLYQYAPSPPVKRFKRT